MRETVPAHLTFAEFISRELSRSENTIEWLAAKIDMANENVLKAVIGGTMKAPATILYSVAKALELNPAHVLNVYLRNYLPDIEQAIFDCGGSMIVSERERTILEAHRRHSRDGDPEVMLFEEKSVVMIAIG